VKEKQVEVFLVRLPLTEPLEFISVMYKSQLPQVKKLFILKVPVPEGMFEILISFGYSPNLTSIPVHPEDIVEYEIHVAFEKLLEPTL
jgi:hypothetical protein